MLLPVEDSCVFAVKARWRRDKELCSSGFESGFQLQAPPFPMGLKWLVLDPFLLIQVSSVILSVCPGFPEEHTCSDNTYQKILIVRTPESSPHSPNLLLPCFPTQ